MSEDRVGILKTTRERLNPEILSLLSKGSFRFDVHVHIFNKDFFPDKYFNIRMPYLVSSDFLKKLDTFLEYISENDDDKILQFTRFIDFVSKKSMSEIADYMVENTPPDTIFCPLMMDFSKGISGKTDKDIFDQLEELKIIRDKYPSLFLPFVAIDPNNSSFYDIFETAFSAEYSFFGVKVYPTLGYMPSHPNLMRIFEQCARYDIPVTTQCGNGGVHTSKSSLNLRYFSVNDRNELYLKTEKKKFFFKKQYEDFFNVPQNWEPVLKAFPSLRLNLAHFGGEKEWIGSMGANKNIYRILDLMERYPNVYSDLSNIIHIPDMYQKYIELFNKNNLVRDRTLFGSGFHIIRMEGNYKEIRSKFVNNIGSDVMYKISVENVLNFLNLSEFSLRVKS